MGNPADTDMPPRTVGIALATYNGGPFLNDMLRSYETQSRLADLIAVSDDHSTDATLAMLEARDDCFPYRVRANPAKGVVSNFENAIRLCDTDYIALSDQDDAWDGRKLEKLTQAMFAAESRFGADMPLLVFSDLAIVDGQLATISPSFYRSSIKRADAHRLGDFILDGHIPGCAMLINRALANEALPFPDVKSHDWWIQIVAAAIGRIVHVDSPLILYRQHGNNTVGLGNFGSRRLIALTRRPFAFISDRRTKIRARAIQVRANAEALIARFAERLSPEDRRIAETVLNGGLLARLTLLDTKRVGMRLFDYVMVMRALPRAARGRYRAGRVYG